MHAILQLRPAWGALAIAGLLAGTAAGVEPDDFKGYAREIEESARLSLAASDAAIDLTVNALANAAAAVNEAGLAVAAALKTESREQIEAGRRKLRECIDSQDDALDLAMKVDLYRRRCREKTDSVRMLIERAFKESDRNTVKSCLRKAEKVSGSASEYAEKASAVAEKTKERWLLPQIPSEATTAD